MSRRVVVTGLGMVTPLGSTVAETWEGILAGRSGITNITHYDTSDLTTRFHGRVENANPHDAVTPKEALRYDPFVHLAVNAAHEAYDDAGLADADIDHERFGASVGSGIGGLPWIEKNHDALVNGGARKVSPFFIPGGIINMANGLVAIKFNCKGPNIAIVTACTTGTHNIGHAARMIAYGDADIMLAGGAEHCDCKLGVAGFASARALSTRNDDPQAASRPFDIDRDGFVMGEGAGVMVLEEYEHAKKRGAKIYAELSGFGMSDDAYHITLTDPDASGARRSMANAIKDAGKTIDDVDYINAHGTSTKANDSTEAKGIMDLFGDKAVGLAVSSTKSMIGHLLGAAGAVEAIFTVLAIRDQIAPPTINLDNPDPACGPMNFVPHKAQPMKIDFAITNSFGFGGTNGTLAFQKIDD